MVTYNHDKSTIQWLLYVNYYCFVMSSSRNTAVLVKSFERAIYMLKIEVG